MYICARGRLEVVVDDGKTVLATLKAGKNLQSKKCKQKPQVNPLCLQGLILAKYPFWTWGQQVNNINLLVNQFPESWHFVSRQPANCQCQVCWLFGPVCSEQERHVGCIKRLPSSQSPSGSNSGEETGEIQEGSPGKRWVWESQEESLAFWESQEWSQISWLILDVLWSQLPCQEVSPLQAL